MEYRKLIQITELKSELDFIFPGLITSITSPGTYYLSVDNDLITPSYAHMLPSLQGFLLSN